MIGRKFFVSITILRFGKTKVGKEEFYRAKYLIKVWDVDVNNVVISKSIEKKNNFKHLIGFLHEVIRPLVLILPKTSGYVKTFKDKGRNESKNNKLMSLRIDDDKLLENMKTVQLRLKTEKKLN